MRAHQFIRGCDANDFKEVSKATMFLDELMGEFGLTLLSPVHTGKNEGNGILGSSHLEAWMDNCVRLRRKGDLLKVVTEPRWSETFEFWLKFNDGTMTSVDHFSGQEGKIRQFVMSRGGKCSVDDYVDEQMKGKSFPDDEAKKKARETLRKAVSRAAQKGAVAAQKTGEQKKKIDVIYVADDSPEDEDVLDVEGT